MVLEASLRYAASCSVVVMDEVADLNERVDVEMREVEEDVRAVVEMRDELRELREADGRLSCQVGELHTLAEDMRSVRIMLSYPSFSTISFYLLQDLLS